MQGHDARRGGHGLDQLKPPALLRAEQQVAAAKNHRDEIDEKVIDDASVAAGARQPRSDGVMR